MCRNFTNGGQHLRLNFGAVNYDATAYMNAAELARHTGATTPSASTSPVPSDPSAARDRGGGALFGGQRHHPGWQPALPAGRNDSLTTGDKANFRAETAQIVTQLKDVTSIIGWIPFNEGWGQWSVQAARTSASPGEVAGPEPTRR
jgi:hypothetical protein